MVCDTFCHPSTVQVMSCYETGLPYCLDPYTLNTIGPDDLGGNIQLGCCAAHFRLDTKKDVSVCMYMDPHKSNMLAWYVYGVHLIDILQKAMLSCVCQFAV